MSRAPRGAFLGSFAVVLGTLLGIAACGGAEPVPPAAPGAPQLQEVPQLVGVGTGRAAETFCLAPPGSGLRAFASFDGHGREIFSIVDVHDLPPASPYRCP